MAAKSPKAPKAAIAAEQKPLVMGQYPDESGDQATARNFLLAELRAAITLVQVGTQMDNCSLDPTATYAELVSRTKQVNGGDLKRAEGTLATQANVLDALFHKLARRSMLNMGEYVNTADIYMKLALRAQSQCRATLETLAAIKNPAPVAFVRQANIGNAVQVNNGAPPRAGENEIPPNKLLEAINGERLDSGAARPASEVDNDVEAVAAINRP